APDGAPWATYAVNVTGCLLIGGLMAAIVELDLGHPLLRPFLGVGVLGGFTTFSTYALDILTLGRSGPALLALAYLVGTVCSALIAVVTGAAAVRRLLGPRIRARRAAGSASRPTPVGTYPGGEP
ncbi:MAG TPA: CrcB family protein, partial [Actinopolymorphaceae bacterium]